MLKAILPALLKRVTARQLCWLCLAATFGGLWYGSTVYAKATDLIDLKSNFADLKSDVRELREDSLSKQIYDFSRRICSSTDDKSWLNSQREEKLRQYKALTGDNYDLRGCDQL